MTKEQLSTANRLKTEIERVKFSLDNLAPRIGESYPVGQKNMNYMTHVLVGIFDEDIYRIRAQAHINDLEKQLAEL